MATAIQVNKLHLLTTNSAALKREQPGKTLASPKHLHQLTEAAPSNLPSEAALTALESVKRQSPPLVFITQFGAPCTAWLMLKSQRSLRLDAGFFTSTFLWKFPQLVIIPPQQQSLKKNLFGVTYYSDQRCNKGQLDENNTSPSIVRCFVVLIASVPDGTGRN
jgi:hypothetical protein